eukprot:Gb_08770 [translate_table: standard]
MIDSSAITVNREDLRSSSRQALVNFGLKSSGVSKSADVLSSFLLSTRSNNSSRGPISHRSDKEVFSIMGREVSAVGNEDSNWNQVNGSEAGEIYNARYLVKQPSRNSSLSEPALLLI